MAWTAPTTRAPGDLITAAIWNADLTDNLAYLKVQTDLVDDITVNATPTRQLTTIYQNSTKVRFVVTTFYATNSDVHGTFSLEAKSDAAATPTVIVAERWFMYPTTAYTHQGMISFFVLPSHYYRIISQQVLCGVPSKLRWVEWDFH